MPNDLALDLRLARRQSGLTQTDVSHLLSIHQTMLSKIELGKRMPSVQQIVKLSLIYGCSFEHAVKETIADAKQGLKDRLATLPNDAPTGVDTEARERTLSTMWQQLVATDLSYGGA